MARARQGGFDRLWPQVSGQPRFAGPVAYAHGPQWRRSIHVLWRWGQRLLPTIRRLRRSEASNRKHAWTTDGANAPPISAEQFGDISHVSRKGFRLRIDSTRPKKILLRQKLRSSSPRRG